MDRLPALIFGLAALVACDSKPAAPPASRTDGAKVASTQPAAAGFCDFAPEVERAPGFRWPALAAGTAPAGAPPRRWVNVWATWCKSCVEEMPRLVAWRDKLAAAGTPVELTFVAVDDAAALAAFQQEHPATPPTLRMEDVGALADWLKTFGLGDGSITLPMHLFVRGDRLRCARSGSVHERDYAMVARQLGS